MPDSPQSRPEPSGTEVRATRTGWILWPVILCLALFVGLFALADLRKLGQVIAHTDTGWLAAPLVLSLASYFAMSLSYHGIARAAGAQVSVWDMFRITLVANTANYILSSGGASGFAARIYLMQLRAVPSGTAVIVSLAQTLMTNFTLLLFILLGFVHLFRSQTLSGPALIVTTGLLALFCAAALVAALLLFHPELRRRTLFYLSLAAHRLLVRFLPHRSPPRTHIWRYQHNLNRGIEFLLARKRQMILPAAYIILDWVFTLMIVYTAFRCVHYPADVGLVTVGFSIGMVSSVISLVPAGLGIMESSMSAVFTSLGVPYESAFVAVLLYRIAYYFAPVAVSFLFFHGTFVQTTHARESLEASDLL